MADKTHIEWTDATWNPITGCSVVSPGCTNCYAMKLAGTRLKDHSSRKGLTTDSKSGPVWNGDVRFNEQWLDQPLKWRKPRMIFVCAHGDLFHETVPDEWIDKVFAIMAMCPQHTFQVLTKRPERMRDYLAGHREPDGQFHAGARDALVEGMAQSIYHERTGADPSMWLAVHLPLKNVWLGVSVEDQMRADERIQFLLETPAAIRWVSAEPLLGAIDFNALSHGVLNLNALTGVRENPYGDVVRRVGTRIDWVVAGGESGHGARPMHPDWARYLRDQCAQASVPFLFKQWGEWLPWEPEHGPCWKSQNGKSEDHHLLFPTDFDTAANWDDGLSYVSQGELLAAFQRVGKTNSGRLLDGELHDAFPERAT